MIHPKAEKVLVTAPELLGCTRRCLTKKLKEMGIKKQYLAPWLSTSWYYDKRIYAVNHLYGKPLQKRAKPSLRGGVNASQITKNISRVSHGNGTDVIAGNRFFGRKMVFWNHHMENRSLVRQTLALRQRLNGGVAHWLAVIIRTEKLLHMGGIRCSDRCKLKLTEVASGICILRLLVNKSVKF